MTTTVKKQNTTEHPGYKHTPLGLIPEEWELHSVDSAFIICNNLRFPISSEVRTTMQGNYPYYGPTKIQDYINEYRIEGKYSLIGEDGDHFLKWKELPMTLLVQGKFNVNNHAHLVKGGDRSITEWFYYYYNHRPLTSYITRQGAGRYKLTKEALSNMPIPLPPLPEQRKIAAILSTWDDAIQQTQALIAQLQKRNKGLAQQLLKPKKEWMTYKIGDLIKLVKRPVEWDDNEKYDLISVRRRSGGAFYRETLLGKDILTKQLFTALKDDFLISKMQIVHGASALVPKELDGMKISGSYVSTRAKHDNLLDINFLNWMSKMSWFYRLTYISSYGVHIEKMTFDYNDFIKHKIRIPASIEEQRQTVAVLEKADEELKQQQQYLTTLQAQKKGLMQQLLTGAIRVKFENENM